MSDTTTTHKGPGQAPATPNVNPRANVPAQAPQAPRAIPHPHPAAVTPAVTPTQAPVAAPLSQAHPPAPKTGGGASSGPAHQNGTLEPIVLDLKGGRLLYINPLTQLIVKWEENDRKPNDPEMSPEAIAGLAESLLTTGQEQPCMVIEQPQLTNDLQQFKLEVGYRRAAAGVMIMTDERFKSRRGGWPGLRCLTFTANKAGVAIARLVENVQREDLPMMGKHRAFMALRKEHGMSDQQIASWSGKSVALIQQYFKLEKLSAEELTLFQAAGMGLSTMAKIADLSAEDRKAHIDEAKKAVAEGRKISREMAKQITRASGAKTKFKATGVGVGVLKGALQMGIDSVATKTVSPVTGVVFQILLDFLAGKGVKKEASLVSKIDEYVTGKRKPETKKPGSGAAKGAA